MQNDRESVADVLVLAEQCEQRMIVAANQALDCRIGGDGAMQWIAESAHYATVATALRTLARTEHKS